MQRHTEQEISDKVSCFFCALRLPEVPFLHYLCKANQKKFCFIRRFWKTTVLSGEKGNEIKKYLKISVIFALSRVEGSEWRYFTKCRPQSWQKYFSPLREIAGRKALLRCLVSGKRAENAASIALLAGVGEARTPRCICSMDRRSRRRHFFRARFYRGAKIRLSLILPLRESCWGVPSPNPAMRLVPLENPTKYFFGFFKNSSASHPVFLLLVRGHHA